MTNLGHLAKEDGDREEARTWWNRAADADNTNTNAMGMLGLLASEDEDRETHVPGTHAPPKPEPKEPRSAYANSTKGRWALPTPAVRGTCLEPASST